MAEMRRDTKIECEEYKEFIRSKPCCVCMTSPVDPDHLKARGLGSGKRNDLTCIPLCRDHHTERGNIGNEGFDKRHHINLWEEAFWCMVEYFIPIAIKRGVVIKRGKL